MPVTEEEDIEFEMPEADGNSETDKEEV